MDDTMILEADQHAAWRAHIDRYAVCPACGGDGEIEGAMDTVDPIQPGAPVLLRELMVCECGHRFWETWAYHGQAEVSAPCPAEDAPGPAKGSTEGEASC